MAWKMLRQSVMQVDYNKHENPYDFQVRRFVLMTAPITWMFDEANKTKDCVGWCFIVDIRVKRTASGPNTCRFEEDMSAARDVNRSTVIFIVLVLGGFCKLSYTYCWSGVGLLWNLWDNLFLLELRLKCQFIIRSSFEFPLFQSFGIKPTWRLQKHEHIAQRKKLLF